MSNQPKRHHFVPECYLKHFISGTHLQVLNIRNVQKWGKIDIEPRQPAGICYIEHYYTIQPSKENVTFNLTRYPKLYIEVDLFRILEGIYSELVRNLIGSTEINRDDAIRISDFIIQIKIRNPKWKDTMTDILRTSIDNIVQSIIENPDYSEKFNTKDPEILEAIGKLAKDRILSEPALIERAQQMSIIERYEEASNRNFEFRKAIVDSKWSLLTAPKKGPFFITTDNPGVGVHNNKIFNTNFVEGEFYFPISYMHCLVIHNVEQDYCFSDSAPLKKIVVQVADSNTVFRINDFIIQTADKLIIASDDWYLSRMAKKNLPPKPTLRK
ncbi:DUF4238 domain-containing protein [Chitinophaga alhagiae]|uniref:DUF4238 domain-containing protein n=1 Tax=Chitinophaga alhagiae TaxID=2203219 RepID=UPI000E5BC838|nr:DUF4238 domain-containing protein [Chitinophaga alhagiae]